MGNRALRRHSQTPPQLTFAAHRGSPEQATHVFTHATPSYDEDDVASSVHA